VIRIIRGARPDLVVEHIGSSAVPGLPGKGIIDLGTEAEPAEIPDITGAMYELGFGPQPGPDAWPPTRPMHVGSIEDGGVVYLVHFHVHPRGTGDLDKDLRFRDALRADPELRDGYARVKTQIVGADGVAPDRMRYQAEKGDWILAAFDRLGIPRPANTQFGGGAATTHPSEQAGGAP
jgi:dephospho-CoA kinase